MRTGMPRPGPARHVRVRGGRRAARRAVGRGAAAAEVRGARGAAVQGV